MFDIGWTEILVVVVVAVVVIGPTELPRVLVSVGRWVTKGRALAREFQDGVQTVMREAELEDLRIDMPDPKSILGDNPITQGKSIVSHNEEVPEDQFIDDDIIAEMEKADMETVETLRQAARDAEEAAAAEEAGVEETGGALEDLSPSIELIDDDGKETPPTSPKSAAES
jgi:sec-independent protein translocase protein TatB